MKSLTNVKTLYIKLLEKSCQDLLIFKISPSVLDLLVRRLFLRPESFGKYARRDVAWAVAVVLITEQNQTGHNCHDCQCSEHQTLGNFFLQLFRKKLRGLKFETKETEFVPVFMVAKTTH